VRRGVADEEDDARGVGRLRRPPGSAHAVGEAAADVLGPVAAALGAVVHERRVNFIEVVGERQDLRHVGVAGVAVGDEADAD
jgi:hypothetical protein